MHVANLGVLQAHNGSVLDLLVKSGFCGKTDLKMALHTATLRCKQYVSAHRLVHSVPMLTRNMLVDASTGSFPARVYLKFRV